MWDLWWTGALGQVSPANYHSTNAQLSLFSGLYKLALSTDLVSNPTPRIERLIKQKIAVKD
jgi:hypothetical protein